MHFDILNRLGKAHECASQTGGQTDRTTYSNSAVQRRAHKKNQTGTDGEISLQFSEDFFAAFSGQQPTRHVCVVPPTRNAFVDKIFAASEPQV